MPFAIVTSKGRITIPAEVRRALNIRTGDRIDFVEARPGRCELVVPARSVSELKGLFGKAVRMVSIDEMNRAVAERGARGRP